jgi:hypothetical protein
MARDTLAEMSSYTQGYAAFNPRSVVMQWKGKRAQCDTAERCASPTQQVGPDVEIRSHLVGDIT